MFSVALSPVCETTGQDLRLGTCSTLQQRAHHSPQDRPSPTLRPSAQTSTVGDSLSAARPAPISRVGESNGLLSKVMSDHPQDGAPAASREPSQQDTPEERHAQTGAGPPCQAGRSANTVAGAKRKAVDDEGEAKGTSKGRPRTSNTSAVAAKSTPPVVKAHADSRTSIESHYDQLASHPAAAKLSSEEASKQRLSGRSYKLKRFHNDIKWRMIQAFSSGVSGHLDLACGRGGDIRKWCDAGISHVRGVDISRHEVAEATRRLRGFEEQRRQRFNYVFEKRDDVGEKPIDWTRQYDSVSCMFAAHYFFVNEPTVKAFLRNASAALVEGGYFYGTIACGKSIIAKLDKKDVYKSELLHLKRQWPGEFGHFQYFGSGYTFAIVQTVTSDEQSAEQVGDGCEEYLVFFRCVFLQQSAFKEKLSSSPAQRNPSKCLSICSSRLTSHSFFLSLPPPSLVNDASDHALLFLRQSDDRFGCSLWLVPCQGYVLWA